MATTRDSTRLQQCTQPLLLAALILPPISALAPLAVHLAAALFGCSLTAGADCMVGGIDLLHLYTGAHRALQAMAYFTAPGPLLVYLIAVGLLAQFTTTGFRNRIVRTFAAMLAVGLMPFLLALSAAIAGEKHGLLDGVAFYGEALFDWLASTAVPLAVLVTGLLALSLGYTALVHRVVAAFSARP